MVHCLSVSPAVFHALFLCLFVQKVFTQALVCLGLWNELLCGGVDLVCVWQEMGSCSFYATILGLFQ